MQELQVEPEGLLAMAGKVEAVAKTVNEGQQRRRDELSAQGADGAWACAGAAQATASRWGAYLSQLSRSISDIAADLRSTADAYGRTDAAAAELLRGGAVPRLSTLTLQQLLAADAVPFRRAADAWRALAEDLDNAAEDFIRGTRDLGHVWSGSAADRAEDTVAGTRSEIGTPPPARAWTPTPSSSSRRPGST